MGILLNKGNGSLWVDSINSVAIPLSPVYSETVTTPILKTKLFPPQLKENHIPRKHLIEQINNGISGQLTLISASAGFGKSSLAAEWLAQSEKPFVWLSADENDSQLERFLTFLITGIKQLYPEAGNSLLETLKSVPLPSENALMTVLINELVSFSADFVLIIDDYHRIDSSSVGKCLEFLVKYCPGNLSLMLISREDPPFPLAGIRANGKLTEIRTEDLRFNQEEMKHYLASNEISATINNYETILEKRIEGWPAGLKLFKLAVSGKLNPDKFVSNFTGSHQYILDYLLEEVLSHLPRSLRESVIAIALPNRICRSLCDALTENSGTGDELLQTIREKNLFIQPLDNQDEWFRFHHLFREFLLTRLPKESITRLHIKAGQWFDRNALFIEAFEHYCASGDIDSPVNLILKSQHLLHRPGILQIVINWLNSLPLSELNERPELRLLQISYLITSGQTKGLETLIQLTETALDNQKSPAELRGQLSIAKATLALTRYQLPQVREESEKALDLIPEENIAYRVSAIWMIGMVHLFSGQNASAYEQFSLAVTQAQIAGIKLINILGIIGMAQIHERENRWDEAEELYQQALDLSGIPALPSASEAHRGLARIRLRENKLAQAEKYVLTARELSGQYTDEIDRYILCDLLYIRILGRRGRIQEASDLLNAVRTSIKEKGFTHRETDLEQVEQEISSLRKTAETSEDNKTQSETDKSDSLIEPLSMREREVLSLIAEGLSNKEICERLFLAMDTVKGHNRRIFRKLDSVNRIQAVNKARELKLIID